MSGETYVTITEAWTIKRHEDSDCFGEVTAGQLNIQGLVWAFTDGPNPELIEMNSENRMGAKVGLIREGLEAAIFLDDSSAIKEGCLDSWCCLLVKGGCGLLLAPTADGQGNTFARVGLMKLRTARYDHLDAAGLTTFVPGYGGEFEMRDIILI